MKVILLKDIKKLGRKYEVKEVADGYALNSLIPNKSVLPATPNHLKVIEEKKKQSVLAKDTFKNSLKNSIEKLPEGKLIVSGKVNDKGALFAGIHKEQIIETFKKETGITIDPEYFDLEKPIKEVGEHHIILNIDNDKYKINLVVKAEE